ncbi:MAG: hypothetical protein V1757_00395 [Actinomycetota bacterium]
MRRLVTVILTAMLLVAACGDDSSSNADPQLVSSLRSNISESPQAQSGELPITDESAQCFAEGVVDELGAETVTAGIDLSFDAFMATLSAEQRRLVVDVMLGCVDVADALVSEMSGSGTGLSEDSARCVIEGMLASDAFRDAVGESFVSGDSTFASDAVVTAMLPVFLECLTPEELANLGNS